VQGVADFEGFEVGFEGVAEEDGGWWGVRVRVVDGEVENGLVGGGEGGGGTS
jgi:hypothetical protein